MNSANNFLLPRKLSAGGFDSHFPFKCRSVKSWLVKKGQNERFSVPLGEGNKSSKKGDDWQCFKGGVSLSRWY
jgi:hypothetical protein